MVAERPLETSPDDSSSLLVDLRGGDTGTVRMLVYGELDTPHTDVLQNAVADLLRGPRPPAIDVDLHGVSFLDAAGIRALLQCHADAERQGCRLRVTGAAPGPYRVLEITGLLDHLGLTGPRGSHTDGWSGAGRLAG